MTEQQQIREPRRKYFTSVPLVYDDANLTVYENRLMTHYLRVGSCWESVRTTALRCSMSATTVIKARTRLNDGGWIVVGENKKGTVQVEIMDLWTLSTTIYGGPIPDPHKFVSQFDSVPDMERAVSNLERSRSNNGTKEDSIKKNTEEEAPAFLGFADSA